MDVVGQVSQCDTHYTVLKTNRYFTPHGNASLRCGSNVAAIVDVQRSFGNEMGSTSSKLPSADHALGWAAAMIESWSSDLID